MRPTHDLKVRVGEYVDREGNKKGRYVDVGKVFRDDNGGEFIAINRTFNPAGVPNPQGKDMVSISRFEIRPRDGAPAPAQSQAPAPAPRPASAADLDEDIPF
jgi:hypothetical protein